MSDNPSTESPLPQVVSEHDGFEVDEVEAVEGAERRDGFAWVGGERRDLSPLWSDELLELLVQALCEAQFTDTQARQAIDEWRDGTVDLSGCSPSVTSIVNEITKAQAYEAEHPQQQIEPPQAAISSVDSHKQRAVTAVAGGENRPKGSAEQLRQRLASLANKLRDDGAPQFERDAIVQAVKRGDFSDLRLSRYPAVVSAIRQFQQLVDQGASQSASHSRAQQCPTSTKDLMRVVKLRLHHDLGLPFGACDRLLKDLSDGAAIWGELGRIPDETVRAQTINTARDLAARRQSATQSQPAATPTAQRQPAPSQTTSVAAALLAAGLRELPSVAGDPSQENQPNGRHATDLSATAASNGHTPHATAAGEEQYDADTSEPAPDELDEQALNDAAPTFDREAFENSDEFQRMRKLMHNRTGATG